MKAEPIGLYIHVPFCVQKCEYCDFCSFTPDKSSFIDDYVDELCREIASYKDRNISLDTVFFGGGTPSLLNGENFKKIMTSVKGSFVLSPNAEITMEANPRTVTKENLLVYISEGVNRFSLGLQSIHENELKILGRIHSFQDFLETYSLIRTRGITNINVDLMYGIPEQSVDSFAETLDRVCSLSPVHISVYGLILEDGTPLFEKRDTLYLPSEDDEADMYYLASAVLSKHGYKHYEISNYAMSDKACKHNLKYWRNSEYIGVGLSAHSYFENLRFSNTDVLPLYLNGKYRSDECAERENVESLKFEYVMMHLRLSEGISLREYARLFGKEFSVGREVTIEKLRSLGLMTVSEDRVALTESGFYVSNSIITELV